MEEASTGTRVHVETDLRVTGPAAQFGRGVMQDVQRKLMGRFADCLAEEIGGGRAGRRRRSRGAGRRAHGRSAAPGGDAATGPAGDSAEAAAAAPAPRPPRRTDEVLDLGEASRGRRAQADRAGLAGLVGLVVLVRILRRRR